MDDCGIDLSALIVPELAKKARPIITCTVEGIIDEDDLRSLAGGALLEDATTSSGSAPALEVEEFDSTHDLKKIREKHHSVARMIASGMPQTMTAKICGYSETYMSILLNSPAIKELIELYRIQQGGASKVVSEKLQTAAGKALERLEEKIDEDKLSATELTAVAKLGFDRSGFGPQSSQHITREDHQVDHARIAELNLRARERSRGQIVPVEHIRKALEAPKPADEAA